MGSFVLVNKHPYVSTIPASVLVSRDESRLGYYVVPLTFGAIQSFFAHVDRYLSPGCNSRVHSRARPTPLPDSSQGFV